MLFVEMVILFGIIFLTASCYGDKLKRKKEIKKKHPKNSINKEMNYILHIGPKNFHICHTYMHVLVYKSGTT